MFIVINNRITFCTLFAWFLVVFLISSSLLFLCGDYLTSLQISLAISNAIFSISILKQASFTTTFSAWPWQCVYSIFVLSFLNWAAIPDVFPGIFATPSSHWSRAFFIVRFNRRRMSCKNNYITWKITNFNYILWEGVGTFPSRKEMNLIRLILCYQGLIFSWWIFGTTRTNIYFLKGTANSYSYSQTISHCSNSLFTIIFFFF